MSTSISGATESTAAQATGEAAKDKWADVSLESFIGLLITELQNQDPMDPMNNKEILEQMSQIREIESNQRLNDTLQSVMLGQTVATASSLIGKTISALSDAAERVSGTVDRITISDGVPKLHVGEHTIDLNNVSEILPEGEGGEEAA